jgi:hypothetical protein
MVHKYGSYLTGSSLNKRWIFPGHERFGLNPARTDAKINITTIYFEDSDKREGFKAVCKAERTNHIRMDTLKDKNGEWNPKASLCYDG